MERRSRASAPAARALLLVAALMCAGCEGERADVPGVRPETVEPPRVQVTLAATEVAAVTSSLELVGNLLPRRRTLIVAEVDGVIASIARSMRKIEVSAGGKTSSHALRLGLGEAVKGGDVLVEIVQRDFELAVKVAEARLAKARADLAALEAWKRPEEIQGLEAALREASARLDETRQEVGRVEKMLAKSAGTQRELDTARAAFLIAKAGHARAAAALALARAGARAEDVTVARAAIATARAQLMVERERLRKTTITAPYAGVVTDVFVEVGDRVTAQPRIEILELMDLSVVAAAVGVPERYAGRIALGDRVAVRIEGVAEPTQGIVVRVNEKVLPSTRTFEVRCAIDNQAGRYKAGQFARVRFSLSSAARNQLTIPAAALCFQDGEPSVFVCDGERVALRRVQVGLGDGERIQVLSGLQAGERVVVHDPALLADGMRVRLAEARRR